MFCLSPGWPQRPCSQGICATGMWCMGGCDTDMSSCHSKSFGDHPDTLSPEGQFWGQPPHPLPVYYGLVLQVPARTLLEGETVTLHCRSWRNNTVTSVSFYHEGKKLEGLRDGTELSLSPLQQHHSGNYRQWNPTAPPQGLGVTVPTASNLLPLWPRAPLLHVFYKDRQVVGGPQGSPQLLVPAVGISHSGNYSCQVGSKGGAVQKSSAQLCITVLDPSAPWTCSSVPGPGTCPAEPDSRQVAGPQQHLWWLHARIPASSQPFAPFSSFSLGTATLGMLNSSGMLRSSGDCRTFLESLLFLATPGPNTKATGG
uniref:Ig-like domain-containing protein n=1 Tax=Zonotrichia albicollis TaxID=44394 RepID=A0A8D2M5P1_ZONAL